MTNDEQKINSPTPLDGFEYPYHHKGITGMIRITTDGKLYARLSVPPTIVLPMKLALSNRDIDQYTITQHGDISLGEEPKSPELVELTIDTKPSLKSKLQIFTQMMNSNNDNSNNHQ